MAVPTIINLWFSGSSFNNRPIRKRIIITEPKNTISWAKGILKDPTPTEKITKTRLNDRTSASWQLLKNLRKKNYKLKIKLRNYLREAAILPPSTVRTAPVVFFEIAR